MYRRNANQKTMHRWYSLDLNPASQITVWISFVFVLIISLFDLTGWAFEIPFLKSIGSQWIPMKAITALCFIFSVTALMLINTPSASLIKKIVTYLLIIIILLVSLLTIADSIFALIKGKEANISELPLLSLFLSPPNRMALISANMFVLVGCILILFTVKSFLADNIAHLLIFTASLVSYFIPVTYLFGVSEIHSFLNTPVALNTGIAFIAVCVSVILLRPRTWLMKVFADKSSGGLVARRLLPGLIGLPVLIGWLRIQGEHQGWFESEVGVTLVALIYTLCFILLVWVVARSVINIDKKRINSEAALRTSESNLRAILNATPESVYMFDRERRIVVSNQTGANRLNSTIDEIIGHRFSEFMPELLAKSRGEIISSIFKTSKPVQFEDERNGMIFSHNFYPVFENEEVTRVVTYSKEITESKKAENELIRSRQEWIETFDMIPDLIAIIDTKHRIVRANKAMLDKLGVSSKGAEGLPCYECVHGTDSAPAFCPHTLTLLDGKQHVTEVHEDRLGGDFIVSNTPMFDNAGTLIGSVHVARDITQRKKVEKELQETKNYLENLIDYSNIPIIVWNSKNEIQLFNHAFENLTGYLSEDVKGKKVDILFPKTSLKESKEKLRLALKENLVTIEIPIRTKRNETRIVLWNSAKIYDNNGNVLSTIAQGNDITQRIKTEEELKLSKDKLNLAMENGSIGVWEWDIVTNEINWDERMEKIFGIETGSFGKTYDAFEKFLFDEDKPHTREAIKKALEQDVPFETVYRINTDNGDTKYINARALLNRDNKGNALKMIGVCYDISEMQKGTEKAIFRLTEDLLRSNKELEQFAYIASHDLQEPLRMVSSFTQLLARRYNDKLDNDAREFIQYAVDGAVRMQGLINDLLEYSRIETRGKKFSPIDIHSVLGHTMKNLSIIVKEKNALVVNDELPVVVADEGQMIQLFQNLIGNALKFSKEQPRIHISVKEDKNYHIFKVKDNGIGIEPQYFNKIFQIFQRLQPREEYGGTGIGLAICKRIVERHGGKIWVESEPGKGSEFLFSISKM